MKKIYFFSIGVIALFSAIGVAAVAENRGTAAAGSAVASPGVIYPTGGDIVQFNNIVVQSVSSANPPAEIVATDVYPVPVPMTASGGATSAPSQVPSIKCLKFESEESSEGEEIGCPPRPSPSANSYRIEVSQDTRLFLRDRSDANLSDFSQGDKINVYGFYNSDGSIRALIVRNLSKPVEKNFYQLNNVELISASASATPLTLVVIQRPIYPCYWFGEREEGEKRSYPCPLGSQSLQNLQGLNIPQSIMPIWGTVRKYEVHVDSRTIIMNRARNIIAPSDMKQGDKLNIYGEMEGDSGPIDADIVRDLSQPPAVSNLEGQVKQVNPDGSFVIQTDDGGLITVQNPIQVGATVKLSGFLNEVQKIISQVSQILIKNQ